MKKFLLILFLIFIFLYLELVSAEIMTINPNVVYPGDTITLTINPIKKFGFYNIISVMKNTEVIDFITVPCDTVCKTKQTVNYVTPLNFLGEYYFATFDYAINNYELDYFNVIEQGGAPSGEFTNLNIQNSGSSIDLLINPEQGKRANITITAELKTRNCETYNLNTYLCDLNLISDCTENTYTHKILLQFNSKKASTCTFNYIGTDYFPFYYPGGDWTIIAKSGVVERSENFTYSSLKAINYSIIVDFGTLNAQMWNIGIPENGIELTNFGNLPITLTWNSRGFECVSENCTDFWSTYENNEDTFQIDDDNIFLEETETELIPVFITNYSINYFPPTPIPVCISDSCNNNIGEKIKTFFNLKIPRIQKGEYEGDINITIY